MILVENKYRRTTIINITSIANFLSINSNEFEIENEGILIEGEFRIYLKAKIKPNFCPNCKGEHFHLKDYRTRIIKHALFYERDTYFYLKYPRYVCNECGKIFTPNTNFAPKFSRKSYNDITLILKALMNYNATFVSVAKLFHTTSTTVMNIFDSYVNPPRGSLPRVLSIDEFYNEGQFEKPYSVILYDFLNAKVLDVVLDRRLASLNVYFSKITREEKQRVEYIIIDMWDPYLELAKIHFPKAIVAIDSFHVMEHLNKAVHDIVVRIRKQFKQGTKEYFLLKKYKYLIKCSPSCWKEKEYNWYFKKYLNEYDIQKMIFQIDPELQIVHDYYVAYKTFNQTATYEFAKENFDRIAFETDGILIKEFVPLFNTLSNWKEYIINSFIVVDGKRLSNGPTEGANSQVKKLMRVGNGYANQRRTRNRIMFCYNKDLLLSPVKEKISKIRRNPRGKYKKSTKK